MATEKGKQLGMLEKFKVHGASIVVVAAVKRPYFLCMLLTTIMAGIIMLLREKLL